MVTCVEIALSKDAAKAISRLDAPTRQRIQRGISALPQGDIKRLQGNTALYRLRIGDWRVLCFYVDNGIYIKSVIPRGEAYK